MTGTSPPGAHSFPVSFSQERLLLLHELDPASSIAYHGSVLVRIDGDLDVTALEGALAAVSALHEALRTRFGTLDGEPVQVVEPHARIELARAELDPAGEAEEELARLARAEARRPFDLAAAPLARATLVRLGPGAHALVTTMHHLVCDGWSIAVFVADVAAAYTALVEGREPGAGEPPIQYGDYAAWQRGWMRGAELERRVEHWRRALDGVAPLDVPADRPRPRVQRFDGGVRRRVLPGALARSVERLASESGATPFIVLTAAFQALLARLSGQTDVAVGTAIANRSRPELEGVVGFFANTLVLRTDLSGDPPFAQALARVRATCLDAYAHADAPFERVVEAVGPERDLGRNPLFQAMIVLQDAPAPTFELPGVALAVEHVDPGTARLDLGLSLTRVRGGLEATLEYRSDLFEPATADLLLERFELLLSAAVADPRVRLGDLPVAAPGELELVERWGTGPPVAVADRRLEELVSESVRRDPDRVAVVAGEERLTYGELERRAAALAARLRALGVGPDVRVGVCVERSAALVVALLGVLKAGGAYVPLDPAYPAERLRFMVEDSGAAAIVAGDERLPAAVPAGSAQVVVLGGEPPEDAEPLDGRAGAASDLAYVVYTSGSSGRPKGVAVEHRGVVNFVVGMGAELGLSSGDVLVAVSSVSFDAAVLELLGALVAGARVVVASGAQAADGERLARLLASSGATMLQATPTGWRLLLDAGWESGAGLRGVSAGERLPARLAGRVLATGARLWNAYGPTEASVGVTVGEVREAGADPPLGRPLPNTYVRVLDERMRPVPIGVAGELHIGGAGVARGYLGRPQLTAERYVADPLAGAGARLYRTGDRARWRVDGELEYLGRLDEQVKLRGHRIELGEIEAALASHPRVRAAVAALRDQPAGEPMLVGYVEADGAAPTAAELRAHARTTLPPHMVPAAVLVLGELPRTPGGKLDRRSLPAPARTARASGGAYVAPRTALEREIAAEVAALLEIDRVGIDDDFFDLGGHSLLVARLFRRFAEQHGIDLPARHFFALPTVAGIARVVELYRRAGRDAVEAAMSDVEPPAPPRLDAHVSPAGLPPAPSLEPRAVLLTGATGFLGAFLLDALLARTDAEVWCLVRGDGDEAAGRRLEAALRARGVARAAGSSRVRVLAGDLAQPDLGLGPDRFAELAERVDAIYHNGAAVDLVQPYATLAAVNVGGTAEVLRLATTAKAKAVHYVSTMDTGRIDDQKKAVREGVAAPDRVAALGYAQSKWAAETLVAEAARRGLRTRVFRPGTIAGHSATGACERSDLLFRLIAGCIRLGAAPDVDVRVAFAPVDWVARAIVDLSLDERAPAAPIPLVNEQAVTAATLYGWVEAAGHPLERVPWSEWRRRVLDAPPGNPLHAIAPVIGEPEPPVDELDPRPPAGSATGAAGVPPCPPIDEALVRTYLDWLAADGALSPPPAVAAEA